VNKSIRSQACSKPESAPKIRGGSDSLIGNVMPTRREGPFSAVGHGEPVHSGSALTSLGEAGSPLPMLFAPRTRWSARHPLKHWTGKDEWTSQTHSQREPDEPKGSQHWRVGVDCYDGYAAQP
jgi:hypothetical protein